MDLITAKVEAAKLSKGGKTVFIVQDSKDETELVTTSKHPGDPKLVFVTFRNGSEIATPEAPEKPVAEKASKEKKEPKAKTNKKVETKAKKPAKKVAAKKDRKPKAKAKAGEMYGKAVTGASKELTVEQIVKALKDGKTVRNKSGFYYSAAFLASRKDKQKKHEVWVREAQR